MKINEKQWQAKVLDLARLFGWKVHHCRPAMRQSGGWSTPIQGDAGFPDLVLARDGEVIFAELKTDSGSLTANQHEWLAVLPSDSAEVWRPSMLDQITNRLR